MRRALEQHQKELNDKRKQFDEDKRLFDEEHQKYMEELEQSMRWVGVVVGVGQVLEEALGKTMNWLWVGVALSGDRNNAEFLGKYKSTQM